MGQDTAIIVMGGGLAGNLVAISLAPSLGAARSIIQVVSDPAPREDSLYGNATAPTARNFLIGLGLDEPRLVRRSATSFSYGTQFRRWLSGASWMQAHHSPLPVLAGSPLRHHLTRLKAPLEPLLVSAKAALAGRFAHPPGDPKSPLSRAEYGFQFDPTELAQLLEDAVKASPVERLEAKIDDIDVQDGEITALRLSDGTTLTGALFIDASGPARAAITKAGAEFNAGRPVSIHAKTEQTGTLGPAHRIVDANESGWSATAFLQGRTHTLTVTSPSDDGDSLSVDLGHLKDAWVGNCVAIGGAAAVLEPLTPAPMMMLQNDIERLLTLIPNPGDMSVEREQYNRRYRDDIAHIDLFQSAILKSGEPVGSAYWQAVGAEAINPKLERKIAQFEHRGTLVNLDLEPFNEEDWTILHLGSGRRPRHYDRQADRLDEGEAHRALGQISQAIHQLVPRIPPHDVYMTKLKQYLEKQNHG